MVKFLHTSDWQLGMKRAYLDDAAQARFDDERFASVRRIVELAEEMDCKFVVVSGDVFETNQPEHETLVRTFDGLQSSTVQVFLLPGNHDSLEPGSVYFSSAYKGSVPSNVTVIDSTDPIDLPGGVQIVGAPMKARRVTKDLIADIGGGLEADSSTLRICVAHGQVDAIMGITNDPALFSLDKSEELIKSGKIHYIALGDSHSAASIGTTGRIWYSGTPVATRRTEPNPNKILVVELDPSECEVKEIEVGSWKFVSESKRLEQQGDVDDFETWIGQIPNKEKTVLRISLQGVLNLEQFERVQSICTDSSALFAALRIPAGFDELLLSPNKSDYEDLQLTGFAKAAFDDLTARAELNDSGSKLAKDALIMLYRIAKEADQ